MQVQAPTGATSEPPQATTAAPRPTCPKQLTAASMKNKTRTNNTNAGPGDLAGGPDAECISHDPADGAAALEALTSPVISTTCTRIPGMRFPDPRVQALLGACCALALRPAGFTSRDLRHYLAPQLGKTPEDMTSGQISYDLRRLRAHQIIERIPHSRAYQVTADGLAIALFLTRLAQRLLIPGLAQLTSPGPPGRSRLRQADRAYRDALTDLARQASLAALRHLQLSPAVITSLSSAVTYAAT